METFYVAFDSYDHTSPVHGWLFAYNASDLSPSQEPVAVFNSTPNGSDGGIGESGAAPSSDSNGNVFVTTSQGTFDAITGGDDYAESLLRLQTNSNASFAVGDRFTPNAPGFELLGTNGVLLLPPQAGSPLHPSLAITGTNAGTLYLFDRSDLASGALQTICLGGPIIGTPAYWLNPITNEPTIYVAAADGTLQAFPLSNGSFSSALCSSPATPSSQSADFFMTYGASPVISSNGSSNGIVWALDTNGSLASAPAILHAYDATNLADELYVSPTSGSGAAGAAVKFAVPTVANGKVYVGTQGELSVFGLLP
jgi:hypothetical protein